MISEKMKNSIRVKELILQFYKKTKDILKITNFVNSVLQDGSDGLFVTESGVQDFINEILKDSLSDEREINKVVNGMLQSLGQSLNGNEEQMEKKEKELFDKNSPQNTLRYCQVLTDKELQVD